MEDGIVESADLEGLVGELSASAWALACLAAALESGMLAELRSPLSVRVLSERTGVPAEVAEALLAVLAALGVVCAEGEGLALRGREALAHPGAFELLRADLRATLLQSTALVTFAKAGTLSQGWSFTDAELLQAQGVVSAGPVPMIVEELLPTLDRLDQRLARPGAAFLDVGAGVARIAIAFAERYPNLHVVGLEPADAPLALARGNVAEAGLESRIELRQQFVQDLSDDSVYDLAWLPIVFLPTDVAEVGLRTVFRALKRGGWLLTGALAAEGADLPAALSRLRARLWGGDMLTQDKLGRMLAAAGFTDIRARPRRAAGTLAPIAARRPPT